MCTPCVTRVKPEKEKTLEDLHAILTSDERQKENDDITLFNLNEIYSIKINETHYGIHKYILKKIHIMDAMLDGDIVKGDLFEINFDIKQNYVKSIIKSLYERCYDMFSNKIPIKDRICIEQFMKYLAIDQENINPVVDTMYMNTNIFDYVDSIKNMPLCDEIISGISKCRFEERIDEVPPCGVNDDCFSRGVLCSGPLTPCSGLQSPISQRSFTRMRTPPSASPYGGYDTPPFHQSQSKLVIDTLIEYVKDLSLTFKDAVVESFIKIRSGITRSQCDLVVGYYLNCDKKIAETVRTGIQNGNNLAVFSSGETQQRFVVRFFDQYDIKHNPGDFEIVFNDTTTITHFIVSDNNVPLVGNTKPFYKGVIGVNIYDTLINHVKETLKKKLNDDTSDEKDLSIKKSEPKNIIDYFAISKSDPKNIVNDILF